MRICTCVIQPFGSLQVVIHFSEWQAAGSRIRQLQTSESRCQNYPFEMINDCLFERSDSALNHFEMIYLLSLLTKSKWRSSRSIWITQKFPVVPPVIIWFPAVRRMAFFTKSVLCKIGWPFIERSLWTKIVQIWKKKARSLGMKQYPGTVFVTATHREDLRKCLRYLLRKQNRLLVTIWGMGEIQ